MMSTILPRGESISAQTMRVQSIVEKSELKKVPTCHAVLGRYMLEHLPHIGKGG